MSIEKEGFVERKRRSYTPILNASEAQVWQIQQLPSLRHQFRAFSY